MAPELKLLDGEQQTLELYRKFTNDTQLPSFLYHDSRYQEVVLGWFEGEKPVGLFFGVIEEGKPYLFIHHISVGPPRTKVKDAVQFAGCVLQWVREHYSITKAILTIEQKEDNGEPICLAILKRIPFLKIETSRYFRQIRMRTGGFDVLRTFRWYQPDRLFEKGYEIIPWSDFREEEIQAFHQAEEQQELPSDYLSPGIWESDWDYDPLTSFALVKKGSRVPRGWVVSQTIKSGEVVKVRRLYINKEDRKTLIGHSFGSWVLDAIENNYAQLQYEVAKGNRQMEMFTDKFCSDLLIFDYFKCNIFFTFEKEVF